MIVLSCNNISKTYVVDKILEDISFTIENGQKIGLIGLNGSGKTTLFNILVGDIPKDQGDIYVQKDLNIGYLRQHADMNSSKTLFQECLQVFDPLIQMEKNLRNLEHEISHESAKGESEKLNQLMTQYSNILEEFNNLNGYGYESEIKGVLKGLGFKDEEFDKNVKVLSGGQKARLSLAKLLLEKPDILLLDEPTNHLDIDAIRWLESYLLEYKGAALIISHDRYFLDNVVTKIFHLENLRLKTYNTNYSRFMEERKKELELLKKNYENQQKEIKRQEEIIRRFYNYGGQRYIRQAQSRQKLLDRMKIIDKPMDSKKVKFTFEPKIKSGKEVLRVEQLGKSFEEFKLLEDINFTIYRGEKVGLIGPNGIGKTTLFKMILGHIPYDTGSITLGHQVHTGYFDQEQTKLNLNKTIIDEIWDDNPKFDHYQIRSILSRFLFIGDDIFKEIEELSGGERGRLALLKMMLSKANFLLMDEPTNHLDIYSKEVLEDAIKDYEGTLLVISHDRYFLNKVTDKILELTEEGITEYLGNYDYYLEKKNEIVYEEDKDYRTKTQIKLERKKEKEKLAIEKRRKKEILTLENLIEEKEKKIEELDRLLCKPELYEEPDKIVQLTKDRDNLQTDLDSLYEKWIIMTEN
ncbi:ABC-F family ATP-binding cassette domain-containing protein [Clostridium sp. Cult1]|uniref:ABC-F family ATP-binding cassette domain-containing protein n=1 Tax=Clostridium sp. Cult1 TaxID=2079002 RepID=UPI001F360B5A|nr:ABC-F family ATP-binding cassette domain-containing protein [Clostridium sp. Cult1]MCF6464040.1 thiamine ABC transporter substrate-binding protein [Clostridium sp. Cult1]